MTQAAVMPAEAGFNNAAEPAAPLKAAWICLGMAWFACLLPIPGLSTLAATVFNIAAIVLAIIVIVRKRIAAGIVLLVCATLGTAIVYFAGAALGAVLFVSMLAGGAKAPAKPIAMPSSPPAIVKRVEQPAPAPVPQAAAPVQAVAVPVAPTAPTATPAAPAPAAAPVVATAVEPQPAVAKSPPAVRRHQPSIVVERAKPANPVVAGILDEGNACMTAKRYDCAIANANAALRVSPNDARAHALREHATTAQRQALNSISIN